MYPYVPHFRKHKVLKLIRSGLTGEGEQRFKVSTLGDAGTVLGAGMPQVFKLSLGDDDAPRHG